MADKICQKGKNDNMIECGNKIRLKKLDYNVGSPYRNKIDDGVCYVDYMREHNVLFEVISIERNLHGNIYKIYNKNYPTFWIEEWQINFSKKEKLEI